MKGLKLRFTFYLIFRGAYIQGLIFGGEFVLVIRGPYIRGGLYSGFYGIYDQLLCDLLNPNVYI